MSNKYFEPLSNQYAILAHVASIDEKMDHIMLVLRKVVQELEDLKEEKEDDDDAGREEAGGEGSEAPEGEE